jgi:hypothetical protein
MKNTTQQPPQSPIILTDENTKELICPGCKNTTFENVHYLRTVSRFVTRSGQEEIMPIMVWRCTHCKKLYNFGPVNDEKKKNFAGKLAEYLPVLGYIARLFIKKLR